MSLMPVGEGPSDIWLLEIIMANRILFQ